LLDIFGADKSLVDAYDVYDCLMNYWGETMQDDCYMISSGGWVVQLYTPQPASKKNDDKKKKEKKAVAPEDIVCDLLPVPIVVDEFFADKRDLINAAEEHLAQNEAHLVELVEEQAENYLDEDNFVDGKMNESNVKKRIKTLDMKKDEEEIAVLQRYLDLKGDVSLNKKLIKELKYDLLTALMVKYADLSEEDIKRLVIEKKWFVSLASRLDGEMQRISQQLTSKVSALAERYAQTLPEIDAEIAALETKVSNHLKLMGY
jgi:type I restriction enzyme M protein